MNLSGANLSLTGVHRSVGRNEHYELGLVAASGSCVACFGSLIEKKKIRMSRFSRANELGQMNEVTYKP
jgi:hypothetical protein